jgi:nicotinamide-nucleotide amidase
MLGVQVATLEKFGAVSEATVREMAAGALAHSHADVALAVSGIAGPGGGSLEKPVGTVWLAWAWRTGEVSARLCQLNGNRSEIRQQAGTLALRGVIDGVALATQIG